MLELTRSTDFSPGTNQSGQVAGANWRFALPNMELDRVLCVGVIAKSTISALVEMANQLTVLCPDQRSIRKMRAQGWNESHVTIAAYDQNIPFDTNVFDLLFVGPGRGQRWFRKNVQVRDLLFRAVKPSGMMYLETHAARVPHGFFSRQSRHERRFWLTPLVGETHTIVPWADHETERYFFKNSLHSSVVKLKSMRRLERYVRPTSEASLCDRLEKGLSKWLLTSSMSRRCGVLAGKAADPSDAPPEYLRFIASDSGIDIQNHRWGLHAAGRYRSRKLLFFLFPKDEKRPEYVVKMVRDKTLNARLENECDALRQLHSKGIFDSAQLPTVEFAGHHAGLAIVGESAIDGISLRTKTEATANCRFAHRAIDWLIELGAKTSGSMASTDDAADAFQSLYKTFVLRYQLSREHDQFLRQQIEAVGSYEGDFPLVFQHGDPGLWNVLVTPGGEAAFLDWEAAESNGVPLWDLFYFLRSFGVTIGRRSGAKSSLTAFQNQLMTDSALAVKAAQYVNRYCEECEIPSQLVAPLFFTCWMHRAVKESTRLAIERMERGHYVNLLRLCIDRKSDLPFVRNNRSKFAASGCTTYSGASGEKKRPALWSTCETDR